MGKAPRFSQVSSHTREHTGQKPYVCRECATPRTIAPQAPVSMGILQARRRDWVAIPPPGDLPDPGTEPVSPVAPALQADSLPLSHRGSPKASGKEPQFLKFIIYLFLTVLRCCVGFSPPAGSGDYSSLRSAGFSLWWYLENCMDSAA